MDQKLKERVFGALVVVAIAVIFIPMVLDRKHEEAVNLSEAIPTPPAADAQLSTPPHEVTALESALTHDNLAAAAQEVAAEPAKTVAATDASSLEPKHEAIAVAPAMQKIEAVAPAQPKVQAAAAKTATTVAVAEVRKAKDAIKQNQKPAAAAKPAPIQQAAVEPVKAPKEITTASEDIPTANLAATSSDAEDDFMAANDETAMPNQSHKIASAVIAKEAAQPAAVIAKQEAAPVAAKPVAVKTAATPKEQPAKVATAPSVSGWAVQFGTFGNQDNAKALQRKLQDKGYTAFLQEVTGDQKLVRVLVGPEEKREDANRIRANVAANAKIKGVIVRYEPLA